MSHDKDPTSASGLLHELDDIRSLLDDALSDDAIPVLEDAVEIVEPAAPPPEEATGLDAGAPLDAVDLEHIPLLQDAIPEVMEEEAFDEPFDESIDGVFEASRDQSFEAAFDQSYDESYDESSDESSEEPSDESFDTWLDAGSAADLDAAPLEEGAAVTARSPGPAAAIAAQPGPAPFPAGATVAELLAAQELQTAIRDRVDATFEHWLNDTLQQELNLLRARLLEAVRAEVHEFVTQQINRSNPTGRPHGE